MTHSVLPLSISLFCSEVCQVSAAILLKAYRTLLNLSEFWSTCCKVGMHQNQMRSSRNFEMSSKCLKMLSKLRGGGRFSLAGDSPVLLLLANNYSGTFTRWMSPILHGFALTSACSLWQMHAELSVALRPRRIRIWSSSDLYATPRHRRFGQSVSIETVCNYSV